MPRTSSASSGPLLSVEARVSGGIERLATSRAAVLTAAATALTSIIIAHVRDLRIRWDANTAEQLATGAIIIVVEMIVTAWLVLGQAAADVVTTAPLAAWSCRAGMNVAFLLVWLLVLDMGPREWTRQDALFPAPLAASPLASAFWGFGWLANSACTGLIFLWPVRGRASIWAAWRYYVPLLDAPCVLGACIVRLHISAPAQLAAPIYPAARMDFEAGTLFLLARIAVAHFVFTPENERRLLRATALVVELNAVDAPSLAALADFRTPGAPGAFRAPGGATEPDTLREKSSLAWSGSERAPPIVEGALTRASVGVRVK